MPCVPVGGDEAVDEDEHLELGQVVAGARVHAAPERQERARTRRHLRCDRTRRTRQCTSKTTNSLGWPLMLHCY
jgi:hypothetical protein